MADDFDDQDFDFEDVDENEESTGEEPAEESGNRRFWILVGILAVVTLLTFICIVAFFLISRNNASGGRADLLTQQAVAYAQQTESAAASAQTLEALSWTATPTVTPNPTNSPTPTQVVVQATDTPDTGNISATQTVEALLTLAAQSTPINTSTALPTTLPDTGFADDIAGGGFIGLIGLAVLALVLIFFARRLRASSG
jgi:flagellar basal body-associated protein FliL